MTLTRAVIATALASLAGQAPQQPVFRAGIDIVQVDVSVMDRDRRPVRGLAATDFTVLEDGKPQEVMVFTAIEAPTADVPSAPWMREIPRDVRSNDLGEARLFAIIMDDAATPPSLDMARTARQIGHRIVEQLGPADLAAVIFTRDNRYAQDFTTERSRLRAAIDRFMPGVVYGLPGTNERSDSYSFTSSLLTLNRVTEYLGTVPQRRKTIFYVSPGVPVDLQEASSVVLIGPGTSMADHDLALDLVDSLRDTERVQSRYAYGLRDALVRAQHGNVNIYSIDPGGLGGLQFFLQNRTSAGAPVEPAVSSMQKASLHREYLKTVANNSGGRAIVDTNDLAGAVAGIFRENNAYYLLGYRSVRDSGDRRVRQVEVQVNRRHVTAQSRNAYYDPKARPAAVAPDPSLRLTNALSGILPQPELALRASVAPFALPGRKTAGLAVVLGIRQPIPSGDIGARVTETVELLTGAFSPAGEDRGNFRQTAQIRMRVGAADAAEFDLLSRLELPPGRYQLRLAAHSTAIDKSGSIYYDVEVPDFTGPQLQMSGLVLAATPGRLAAPDDAVTDLTPIVPTSRREFAPTDAVRGFVQVYAGSRAPGVPIAVTTRITDDNDQVVSRTSEAFGRERFDAARLAAHLFDVPIDRLKPGRFLLTVEAVLAGRTVRRDAALTIK